MTITPCPHAEARAKEVEYSFDTGPIFESIVSQRHYVTVWIAEHLDDVNDYYVQMGDICPEHAAEHGAWLEDNGVKRLKSKIEEYYSDRETALRRAMELAIELS